MFMACTGGILVARSEDPPVVLMTAAQKLGASVAVGLGVRRGLLSPLALGVAGFDALSGLACARLLAPPVVTTALAAGPEATPRRSLLLAGGGIRVAYQAGVLVALEEAGLRFHHADGTSGGTFNLAMLLSGVHRRRRATAGGR